MANVKAGNTYFIDTTDTLADVRNSKIKMIIIQATAANGTLVIQDGSSQNKLSLKVVTSGETKRFNFDGAEISVNNGLKVTVSNTVSTIIFAGSGG